MLPAAAREVHVDAAHPVTDALSAPEPWIHDEPHVLLRLSGAQSLATLAGADADAKTVPAIVVHQYGAGRVVYLPGRFDAIQSERLTPRIERLFANAVRWASHDTVPVEVRAPAPIAVTLFDQPERRILHLVNLNGDSLYRSDKIAPIEYVTIELQIPKGRQVQQLRRLWDRALVPFRADGSRVSFTLERLGDYEAISAELTKQK